MNVSVVICAYTMDRWVDLVASVQSCVEQSKMPHEVVVVIDYNDILLRTAKQEFVNAVVVPNRFAQGLSGARNTGVAQASGDVVAFLDDDAYADRNWLKLLSAPMSDEDVVGVGGWVVPNWPGERPPWFPDTFLWVLGCSYSGLPDNHQEIRNPIGASMAMRRRLFEEVGGFSSGLGRMGRNPLGCEETELCIRYSTQFPDERFVLCRDAVVHHRVPPSRLTWRYFSRRCWSEGLSKAAVSSLVGPGSGLASERRHVLRSMPRELAGTLLSFPRHPRTSTVRFALILAGSILAVMGLVRGQIALRKSPLDRGVTDLEMSAISKESRGPCSPLAGEED